MRISDWSSDVCSSDLVAYDDAAELRHVDEALGVHREAEAAGAEAGAGMDLAGAADLAIGQRNVGADHRAVADDHRRPDHAVGLDPAAAADLGAGADHHARADLARSEEHTSELQSLMRHSSAVFCLKKKTQNRT